MPGYIKLFGSILQSSVWDLPPEECKVWVTIMALADRDGVVSASLSGLAHEARLPRETVERALGVFTAPDPDSRTPDHEGRRLEKVDGGWRMLNHAAYRALESVEDRRTKNAQRQKRWRDNQKAKQSREHGQDVTPGVTKNNESNGIRSDQIKPPEPPLRNGPDASPASQPKGQSENAPHARAGEAAGPSWRWTGHGWHTRFAAAWFDAKGRMYGRGSERDSRATGEIHDILASLPEREVREAQAKAKALFATFLSDTGEAARAGHPWSWFVGRFNGLRDKVLGRAGDFGDMSASEYPEEDEGRASGRGA